MGGERGPDGRATALVAVTTKVPGGPWFIELREPGRPAYLGPYENKGIAEEDARRVRELVAAVLREGARFAEGGEPGNEKATT